MCWRGVRPLTGFIAFVICTHVACKSPTAPTPLGYVGEWTGTTPEGTSVRFSVSADDEVTFFAVTYNVAANCSGTLTYEALAVPIHTLDPPGPPPFDQPGFGFSTISDDKASGTLMTGWFSPDRRSASGQFTLVHYGACGTIVGNWGATRR